MVRSDGDVLVELTGVRKAYGETTVLHGLDLTIGHGERVALMGPSGSGKSTLLNCLSGIEKVDTGTIRIAGKDLSKLGEGELDQFRRASIGYIFQSFHLLPTLTASENIELPGELNGFPRRERRERVGELLEAVGLGRRAHHRPDQMSGGERQRVAIARALMHRPQLILADEPTGSLDSESGNEVLELIRQLSEETGTGVLLVTHDPGTTRICDRTLRMRDGRIES